MGCCRILILIINSLCILLCLLCAALVAVNDWLRLAGMGFGIRNFVCILRLTFQFLNNVVFSIVILKIFIEFFDWTLYHFADIQQSIDDICSKLIPWLMLSLFNKLCHLLAVIYLFTLLCLLCGLRIILSIIPFRIRSQRRLFLLFLRYFLIVKFDHGRYCIGQKIVSFTIFIESTKNT